LISRSHYILAVTFNPDATAFVSMDETGELQYNSKSSGLLEKLIPEG
jgi:hypothetical protein